MYDDSMKKIQGIHSSNSSHLSFYMVLEHRLGFGICLKKLEDSAVHRAETPISRESGVTPPV